MVAELNTYGICSTCNNRPECLSFQKNVRRNTPVLHCEEFENIVPGSPINTDANGKKNSYKPLDHVGEMISERAVGLCVNCAVRKTCMLPPPEGGVLYCEEYL